MQITLKIVRGIHCPFCDSRQLDMMSGPEIDGPVAAIETICVACGKTWWDIYTLTDIQTGSKTALTES